MMNNKERFELLAKELCFVFDFQKDEHGQYTNDQTHQAFVLYCYKCSNWVAG